MKASGKIRSNGVEVSDNIEQCFETDIYIHTYVKIPTIIEMIRLNRLRWFGHVQRMEENRIFKIYEFGNNKIER